MEAQLIQSIYPVDFLDEYICLINVRCSEVSSSTFVFSMLTEDIMTELITESMTVLMNGMMTELISKASVERCERVIFINRMF